MNSQSLIAELEHELISTAKLLDLVPPDMLSWKPNPRAMSLGQLANHVALIPVRYLEFADEGSTELDELTNHHSPKNKAEVLDNFASGSVNARKLLANLDSRWQGRTWNLKKNDEVVFSLPIQLFVRLLVLNHLYHHRGQLSSYLRILNLSIPSIYGPSGDENPFA